MAATIEQIRTLLIAEDLDHLGVLKRVFEEQGHLVSTASDGLRAIGLAVRTRPDIVVLDLQLPGDAGKDVLTGLRTQCRNALLVVTSEIADTETIAEVARMGADEFVVRPYRLAALKLRAATLTKYISARQQHREQRSTLDEVHRALGESAHALETVTDQYLNFTLSLLDLNHPELTGHLRRVASFATAVGTALGLVPVALTTLERAALVHDIGLLHRMGEGVGLLDALHDDKQHSHAEEGAQMIEAIPQLRPLARIIRQHHLHQQVQPLDRVASILAVVDTFDIGTCTYGGPREVEQTTAFIARERGRRFDAEVVDAALPVLRATFGTREAEVAVAIDTLQPGMILARDARTASGQLLLARGLVLDAVQIGRLRQVGLKRIGATSIFVTSDSILQTEAASSL